MWSNGDVSGQKSAHLFLFFALALIALGGFGMWAGLFGWIFFVANLLITLWKMQPVWAFRSQGEKALMRKGFLRTLLYLPVCLVVLAFVWR